MRMSKQMRKRRITRNKRFREEDKFASKQMDTILKKDAKKFDKKFMDSGTCQVLLEEWMGWRKNGKVLKSIPYKCNGKKKSGKPCDSAYYHRVKKNEKDVVSEEKFRCSKCGHKITLFSETLFKKRRTGYWIWFFSLYCMMLLEGKRPVTYLVGKYVQYLDFVGDDQLKIDGSKEKKLKKKLKQRIKRITEKIYEELFENATKKSQRKKIERYGKLVGLRHQCRYDDFIAWYKADEKKRKDWKLGFRDRSHPKRTKGDIRIAKDNAMKSVKLVQYFNNKKDIDYGHWVLCVRANPSKSIKSRWMRVEDIDELKNNKTGCEFQAIQINKNPMFAKPFRITDGFRKAFNREVELYLKTQPKDFSKNGIVSCPDKLLNDVAKRLKKKE